MNPMFLQYLHQAADGRHLSSADAYEAMSAILNGEATPAQIAAFLVALRMKSETAEELLGFARAMRDKSERVEVDGPLLDTCGTGGDGGGTFNVSTVAAFVASGAGVRVAKHGNRSISSQCGSADVLETLGIDAAMSPSRVSDAIRQHGIGFMLAPLMHPAMKHAHSARTDLKMRTAFNLLGPLTNPARATRQLIGAPSEHAAGLMANALAGLGMERAFVVHGCDGLDEVTTTAPTIVFEVRENEVRRLTWTPHDFGVPQAAPEHLAGGNRHVNCDIACAVLQGRKGPHRDIVLVNAAAALIAAGSAAEPREAVERAADSIDSGAAWSKVEAMRAFSAAANA
jgi:anthranilate phosphoribosyltransferase